MKCFCDIPLGIIKKHLSKYGKFGIGVTKDYAKTKTISPVIYIHENSDTLKRYLKSMKKHDVFNDPHSLLPYFKIDERKRNLKNGKVARDRFYDEREWRYIPSDPAFIDFTGFDEDEIRKIKLESENNNLEKNIKKYILPFEYNDITYIFVQQQDDVDNVINEIKKIKINHLDQDRLLTKIITSRQMERDF